MTKEHVELQLNLHSVGLCADEHRQKFFHEETGQELTSAQAEELISKATRTAIEALRMDGVDIKAHSDTGIVHIEYETGNGTEEVRRSIMAVLDELHEQRSPNWNVEIS